MQNLKVTLIQSDLVWENRDANLRNFEEKIAAAGRETDIIVLPEMFSTGFSMKPEEFAEPEGAATVEWMRAQALKSGAAVTGSIMVEDVGSFYNRLLFVEPGGRVSFYDKRHLFSMGGEDNHFAAGKNDVIINYKGVNIKFLICYDLRFPVWAKNNYRNDRYEYDVLLIVANWPAVRSRVWKTLLSARAIENQAYVVGVNRIGNDGNGLPHSGNSNVVDPKGIPVLDDVANEEFIKTVSLDIAGLYEFRDKFTVGPDWDIFDIRKEITAEKSGDKYSDRKSQSAYDG